MKKHLPSLPDLFYNFRYSGVCIFAVVLMLIPVNILGQKKCTNPPAIVLGESSGSTCSLTPKTVNNNQFGGSATGVKLTTNGHGSIEPSSVSVSPFSFTYTPANTDRGKTVTITLTTTLPAGSPCRAVTASYLLNVTSSLSAPVIENIVQTTCTSSTGSVVFNGLPSSGNWTLTASPGGIALQGSGTTATMEYLPSGTYTFTVSVSGECVSDPSEQVVINGQPVIPAAPVPGAIIQPSCIISTGSVNMAGLPISGTWTLIRYPGTVRTNGTGASALISGLPPGIFNFAVMNEAGCVSVLSDVVTISAQPPTPEAPTIDSVIQPTADTPTGSVTLNNLPSAGTWSVISSPGEVAVGGSGAQLTITGIETGTYTFRVVNNFSCVSSQSAPAIISIPDRPELIISNPPPVCYPSTVDLTLPEITAGSTSGLTYSYWSDSLASVPLPTPAAVTDGKYYIKGTAASGFFDLKPVSVRVQQPPVANAGPDQTIPNSFDTVLAAVLAENETGKWYSDSANVFINDINDPASEVSNLSEGENILSWIVTNDICPADTDKVSINVGGLVIPTLITPNGDSRNEYFIIKGLDSTGKNELTIFDRRGAEIYRNSDYDNSWNGVDYNEKPVMNDTYFFVLKTETGKSYSGYIVIRR
jgi:gliding motility-associated-like protein